MDNRSVSIVVPAFNSQKTILRCIESLLDQSFQNTEVIIVDDGSTDHTAKIVQRFEKVVYVHQENAGPAAARNRGAAEAKNELVFFTDSDCIARRDWIEVAMKQFEDPDVAVVSGSYGIANPENLLARCIYKEIIFRHNHLVPRNPKVFGSYNFGIRKKVFDGVGRFNECYRSASGEDNDLSYKIIKTGHKIYFETKALVDHYHPVSLVKYLKEQFRHGFWRVKMYKDHIQMTSGDGYTFWKDIVELPLVLIFLVSTVISIFSPVSLAVFSQLSFLFLLFLEIIYGLKMTGNISEALFLSIVMLFRSFSRFFGFLSGVPLLIKK